MDSNAVVLRPVVNVRYSFMYMRVLISNSSLTFCTMLAVRVKVNALLFIDDDVRLLVFWGGGSDKHHF